jgi:hypothetical protein
MAITAIGPSGSSAANSNELTFTLPTTVSGTNRMMLASIHTRGNPGQAAVTDVELRQQGTSTTVADFSNIHNITADNIIHAHIWVLWEASFPANGIYDLWAYTSGGFQIAGYVQTFSGVDQSGVKWTGGNPTKNPDNRTIDTTGIPVTANGRLLADTCSADDPNSTNLGLANRGLTRDFQTNSANQGNLRAGVAGTIVDISDSPISIGWSFDTNDNNRLCHVVTQFGEDGGTPPGAGPNTVWMGTHF